MPRNINLPSERVLQLEALAEKWNMTVADVVGEMIHQQIKLGELAPDLPGIHIEKSGENVVFGTEDWSKTMQPADASGLSKAIRAMITPSKDNPLVPLPDFDLVRRGTSIKLRDPKTGAVRTFAPSIARDVADRLDEVSKS